MDDFFLNPVLGCCDVSLIKQFRCVPFDPNAITSLLTLNNIDLKDL